MHERVEPSPPAMRAHDRVAHHVADTAGADVTVPVRHARRWKGLAEQAIESLREG
ncbi:MAG TPA: hypothetical protein VGB19_06410 [Actinomycetota bacterium]